MSSMDRTSKNGETVFSKTAENYQSQKLFKDILYQKVSGFKEEKTCQVIANGQTLRTLLKRIQEKRSENEDRKEKEEEISDSLYLEALHVQRVYNQIAPHIQDLKQRTWPRVKEFLKSLKPGSLVADIGCGSGRYLHINPSIFKIGSDICLPFLHSASLRGFEVISADNLLLPFRDGFFDAAISIGVIHHFASQERRVQALQELARIVCSGGLLMVYVWAFEQKYRKFDSQDILVPWHKPRKSESGCRRPCLSSMPDADRLSTSSTGSSLSDEEFTAYGCYRQNLNTDSYSTSLLTPVTCPVACSGSDHQGRLKGQSVLEHSNEGTDAIKEAHHARVVGKDGCFSHEEHLSEENLLNLSHPEHQLAKGEALIRECQKVECYLSSLSKNPLESLPEKSKSSGSVPDKPHSPGLLKNQVILNSVKKRSPSCWSPSYQDDEVFIRGEPTQQDQIKLDSPKPGSSAVFPAKALPRKQQLVECAVDSSFVNDPLQCSLQEMNSDSGTDQAVPHSLALLKTSSNTSERKLPRNQEYAEQKRDNQRRANKTVPHHLNPIGEFLKFRPNSSQDQGSGEEFLPLDDDFCILNSQAIGVLSETENFSGCSHTSSLPGGILNMLKRGFKNIFTGRTTENGTHPAPCFVPCLQQSLPPEHFQIRKFPQSSLPSGAVLGNSPNNGACVQLESANSVSECDTGLDSCLPPNADATANHVLQCQNFHQSHFTYQSPLKGQPNRSVLSVTSAPQCSENYEASRSKPIGSSGIIAAESDLSLSSTTCQKDDTINTDLCRFYHVFREGELVSLVTQHIPGVKVVDSFYDHANWCLILEKV